MINKIRLSLLLLLTLICFAGNSLLCRLALRSEAIDPVTFTLIRLLSGAIILCFIVWVKRTSSNISGSWRSGVSLFVYAAAFSWAYVNLTSATGALILFTCVQSTMIISGFLKGERLTSRQIVGCLIAISGLIILLFPGLSTPAPGSAALMAMAGIAWGIYSLMGRSQTKPIESTTGNFLRALPFAIVIGILALQQLHISNYGLVLAVLSGAITSGLGYAVWYSVLPSLSATSASIVQLSVPILATLGGAMFLGEVITLQIILSSFLTLFGIGLAIIK